MPKKLESKINRKKLEFILIIVITSETIVTAKKIYHKMLLIKLKHLYLKVEIIIQKKLQLHLHREK